MSSTPRPAIDVRALEKSYGDQRVLRGVDLEVRRGETLVILGGSGSGKSTLLRCLVGLERPDAGSVRVCDTDIFAADRTSLAALRKRMGMAFQGGALFGSMTVAENVELPLAEFTDVPESTRRIIARIKLGMVGLEDAMDRLPSELSGGMRKRAALARALALDPEILFFDEPSAGLDPVSARRLDDLIIELRDSLGTTMVVVTHELASIFAIANNSAFLDPETKTMIAHGDPKKLLAESQDPKVIEFLTRGEGREKP